MSEQARRKIGALVRAMAGRCRRRDFAIAGIEIRSKGYRTIPALFGIMQVCCQLFCRSSRTMATVISSWCAPLRRTALAATASAVCCGLWPSRVLRVSWSHSQAEPSHKAPSLTIITVSPTSSVKAVERPLQWAAPPWAGWHHPVCAQRLPGIKSWGPPPL